MEEQHGRAVGWLPCKAETARNGQLPKPGRWRDWLLKLSERDIRVALYGWSAFKLAAAVVEVGRELRSLDNNN